MTEGMHEIFVKVRLDMDRQTNENIHTMLFRVAWTHRQLAAETGISQPTIGRRLNGTSSWSLDEISEVAHAFRVSPLELMTQLPSFEEWLPRLDSNQQPSGYQSAQVIELADYRNGRLAAVS